MSNASPQIGIHRDATYLESYVCFHLKHIILDMFSRIHIELISNNKVKNIISQKCIHVIIYNVLTLLF